MTPFDKHFKDFLGRDFKPIEVSNVIKEISHEYGLNEDEVTKVKFYIIRELRFAEAWIDHLRKLRETRRILNNVEHLLCKNEYSKVFYEQTLKEPISKYNATIELEDGYLNKGKAKDKFRNKKVSFVIQCAVDYFSEFKISKTKSFELIAKLIDDEDPNILYGNLNRSRRINGWYHHK